jgi:hypothetical protein
MGWVRYRQSVTLEGLLLTVTQTVVWPIEVVIVYSYSAIVDFVCNILQYHTTTTPANSHVPLQAWNDLGCHIGPVEMT